MTQTVGAFSRPSAASGARHWRMGVRLTSGHRAVNVLSREDRCEPLNDLAQGWQVLWKAGARNKQEVGK